MNHLSGGRCERLVGCLIGRSLINTLVLGIVDVIAISGFVEDLGLQSLPWYGWESWC
ncbi:MAG: hypothetical protein L3J16_05260 [Anaerolineales bacterium]|nr:hypothetical protein [Anaerolineales bacterium]